VQSSLESMTDRIMHHLGQVFRLRFCKVVPFVDAEKVGFGSFASVWPDHGDFRSIPVNGHSQGGRTCLKGATNGH
jgi:hypothetical protein